MRNSEHYQYTISGGGKEKRACAEANFNILAYYAGAEPFKERP